MAGSTELIQVRARYPLRAAPMPGNNVRVTMAGKDYELEVQSITVDPHDPDMAIVWFKYEQEVR